MVAAVSGAPAGTLPTRKAEQARRLRKILDFLMSDKTEPTPSTNMTEPAALPLIRYCVDSGVAVVELNEPPANTYSYEMNRQLDDAILAARMDENVHVIVLTGAGDKFFCAGANIQMLAKADPTFKYYFCLHANETLLRLENTPKLVIAAINGHCVGGGLEVAMAYRSAHRTKDAGKIGLPEVNLGACRERAARNGWRDSSENRRRLS